jgi:hypothetical protein
MTTTLIPELLHENAEATARVAARQDVGRVSQPEVEFLVSYVLQTAASAEQVWAVMEKRLVGTELVANLIPPLDLLRRAVEVLLFSFGPTRTLVAAVETRSGVRVARAEQLGETEARLEVIRADLAKMLALFRAPPRPFDPERFVRGAEQAAAIIERYRKKAAVG